MTGATTSGDMSTGLLKVAERARRDPDGRILALARLIDVAALRRAYDRQRKDAAAGVDGVTKEDYGGRLEDNLQDLHERLKSQRYRHQPIRRVHIPKDNGTTRPIGISAFEDKLVQDAVREVLEAIYEQDFLPCSYGFRPGRSAHDAVRALAGVASQGRANWILETDVASFFDSVDRTALMGMLRLRIADETLLRIVGKCLHVGVLDGGEYSEPEMGTAQGSVLSPMLGNVYLHYALDAWFEREAKPRLRGAATLIRYADDLLIAFERKDDAERVMAVLGKRLGRYGLTLHRAYEKYGLGAFAQSVNGNFEGRNILYVDGRPPAEEPGIVRQAKAALLKEREKRVKPARDEKILASWNGLMLASLAEAACVFNRDDYLQAAIKNGEFLLGTMISEGYLLHSCKEGKARIPGYLDDYAMVIEGLLNLHQATFSGRWLKEAVRLTDIMAEEFWDESEGTFYDTGKRHPDLFIRPRNIHDGAVPCGSSSAALVLLKASRLTGIRGLGEKAEKALGMVADDLMSYPLAYSNWLCALDLHLSALREIAVIGSRGHPLTADLVKVIFENWLPNASVAAADPDDPEALTDIMLLKNRSMVEGRPTVYLCEGYSCLNPMSDPDLLRTYLMANNPGWIVGKQPG